MRRWNNFITVIKNDFESYVAIFLALFFGVTTLIYKHETLLISIVYSSFYALLGLWIVYLLQNIILGGLTAIEKEQKYLASNYNEMMERIRTVKRLAYKEDRDRYFVKEVHYIIVIKNNEGDVRITKVMDIVPKEPLFLISSIIKTHSKASEMFPFFDKRCGVKAKILKEKDKVIRCISLPISEDKNETKYIILFPLYRKQREMFQLKISYEWDKYYKNIFTEGGDIFEWNHSDTLPLNKTNATFEFKYANNLGEIEFEINDGKEITEDNIKKKSNKKSTSWKYTPSSKYEKGDTVTIKLLHSTAA